MVIKVLFWISLGIALYAYVGYPMVLFILSKFKKPQTTHSEPGYEPTVTLFVAAYNEEDNVHQKVKNAFETDYPNEKLQHLWVTDGSMDKTNKYLSEYPGVKVLYHPERKGKINAMNRGMKEVDTDVVIFSDGNTILNKAAVKEIIKEFSDPKIGCVAGEKRIELTGRDSAAAAGEGFYWKYESWLKQKDAEVGSCIGAAGELFAIRTGLFEPVEEDTILDDFIISLRIAMKGLKVGYSKNAYAIEKASANIHEEMKRKVRIAAGSIQTFVRLKSLSNVFKYKLLSFQYLSHKVFRWILTPIGLLMLIPLNIILAINEYPQVGFYTGLLLLHTCFYLLVIVGYLFRNRQLTLRTIFLPYYFFMANYAMWLGFYRYVNGKQSVNWERARRST